jgi:hypothetical protein
MTNSRTMSIIKEGIIGLHSRCQEPFLGLVSAAHTISIANASPVHFVFQAAGYLDVGATANYRAD